MSKPRNRGTDPRIPPDEAGAPAGAPAGRPAEAQDLGAFDFDPVGDLLSELAEETEAEVCVFRAPAPGSTREEYLFVVPASGTSLTDLYNTLRDEWGGGEFRIRGRQGSRWIKGSRTVAIASRPGKRAPLTLEGQAAAVPAPAAGLTLGDVRTLMLEQQNQMFKLLLERPQPAPSGTGMNPELLKAIAPLAVPLVSGVVDALLKKGSPVKELADVLALVREVAPGGGGDSPSSGAGAADVIVEGMRALPALMQTIQAAQASQPPAASPAAPGPAAVTQGQPPPDPQAQAQKQAQAELQRFLAIVVNAAEKNSDPAAYAVLALDLFGDETMRQFVTTPNMVQSLAALNPGVAQHAEWMTELLSAIKDELDAEVEPPPA